MSDPPSLPQAWRLARRELRGGLHGFGVFLTCLFLGVFAIAAVGSVSAATRRGLLSDARALLGGDLEIHLVSRQLSASEPQFVSRMGTVSAMVEMRAMARAVKNGRRTLVELKAVDHAYPLYGSVGSDPSRLLAENLAQEPGDVFGALAEAALLARLGVKVGDILRLGNATLRITGVLTREPDRTLRAFTLGPRLLISRAALAATGHPQVWGSAVLGVIGLGIGVAIVALASAAMPSRSLTWLSVVVAGVKVGEEKLTPIICLAWSIVVTFPRLVTGSGALFAPSSVELCTLPPSSESNPSASALATRASTTARPMILMLPEDMN